MSSLSDEQRALVREQSAALNRALSGTSGASRVQGGKLTGHGRRMLEALAAAEDGAATPAELIAAHPETYGGDVRSRTAGLHLTGAHLVRQGYAKRGRRQVRSRNSGDVQGGARLYRITETGKQALR